MRAPWDCVWCCLLLVNCDVASTYIVFVFRRKRSTHPFKNTEHYRPPSRHHFTLPAFLNHWRSAVANGTELAAEWLPVLPAVSALVLAALQHPAADLAASQVREAPFNLRQKAVRAAVVLTMATIERVPTRSAAVARSGKQQEIGQQQPMLLPLHLLGFAAAVADVWSQKQQQQNQQISASASSWKPGVTPSPRIMLSASASAGFVVCVFPQLH